jgi:hypothetical protein
MFQAVSASRLHSTGVLIPSQSVTDWPAVFTFDVYAACLQLHRQRFAHSCQMRSAFI